MSIIGNFPVSSSDEEQTAAAVAAHNNSKDAHEDIRTLAAAAATKQDKLTGKKGQVVGFSDTGTAVAQDNIPTVEMTQEGYDALSETEKQSAALYVVHDGQSSGGATPSAHAGGGSASDGIIIKYKGKSISAGSSPGVTSFNGRTGAVQPESGDYDVSKVPGAAPVQNPVFSGRVIVGTGDCVVTDIPVGADMDTLSSLAIGQFVNVYGPNSLAVGSGANCGTGCITLNSQISPALLEDSGGDYQAYLPNVTNSFLSGIYVDGQFSGSIVNSLLFTDGTQINQEWSEDYTYDESAVMQNVFISGYFGAKLKNNIDNTHIEGYHSSGIFGDLSNGVHIEGTGHTVIGVSGGVHIGGYSNHINRPYTNSGAFIYGEYIVATSEQNDELYSVVLGSAPKLHDLSGVTQLVIGKGSYVGNGECSFANSFRVAQTEVYGGTYRSAGADYAELFEWLDGNPDEEDRAGRFVTLEGDKLRLATPEDDFILGIVSGNPSIVGDVHDDQWRGMYQQDIFGRYIWEDVEVPEEVEERPDPRNPGKTIMKVKRPAHIERRQAVNPDYNPDQKYTPRSDRPEWDAVGMMGKLVVVDDGTCQVNGWCSVATGGTATASTAKTRYRVMSRLDETHVLLLLL